MRRIRRQSNPTDRRSSCGVLPGAIGIESGVILDHPTRLNHTPMTSSKFMNFMILSLFYMFYLDKHPHHRRIRQNFEFRRHSLSTCQPSEISIKEEPSVNLDNS